MLKARLPSASMAECERRHEEVSCHKTHKWWVRMLFLLNLIREWLRHNFEGVNYPCSYTATLPDLWELLTICCTVDLLYLHTLQSKLIKYETNATVIAPSLTFQLCSVLSKATRMIKAISVPWRQCRMCANCKDLITSKRICPYFCLYL